MDSVTLGPSGPYPVIETSPAKYRPGTPTDCMGYSFMMRAVQVALRGDDVVFSMEKAAPKDSWMPEPLETLAVPQKLRATTGAGFMAG